MNVMVLTSSFYGVVFVGELIIDSANVQLLALLVCQVALFVVLHFIHNIFQLFTINI